MAQLEDLLDEQTRRGARAAPNRGPAGAEDEDEDEEDDEEDGR